MAQNMLMVLSFLAAFTITTGLRCYECFSFKGLYDLSCINPNVSTVSNSCRPPSSGNYTNMCMSMHSNADNSSGGFGYVSRGCFEVRTNTSHCVNRRAPGNQTILECYCNTDNCRGEVFNCNTDHCLGEEFI